MAKIQAMQQPLAAMLAKGKVWRPAAWPLIMDAEKLKQLLLTDVETLKTSTCQHTKEQAAQHLENFINEML